MSTTDAIRQLIARSFTADDGAPNMADDDDLLSVLDSLQVLRLVADIEDKFSIKIETSEMTPDNFGSLSKLAGFVERKAA